MKSRLWMMKSTVLSLWVKWVVQNGICAAPEFESINYILSNRLCIFALPQGSIHATFLSQIQSKQKQKKRKNRRDKIKMATRISTLWLILARWLHPSCLGGFCQTSRLVTFMHLPAAEWTGICDCGCTSIAKEEVICRILSTVGAFVWREKNILLGGLWLEDLPMHEPWFC